MFPLSDPPNAQYNTDPMFIGLLNPPNLVTLTGLLIALAGGMLAARGYVHMGMVALIIAGICDLFDGYVARSSDLSVEEQGFGAQLDSLNDVVCFGILPVVLVDSWLRSTWAFPVFALYLIAVLFRLAHFNLHGTAADGTGGSHYTGLPVTYAALALPLSGVLAALLPEAVRVVWLLVTLLLLATLYVYKTPIPKPQGKAYLAFPILAALVSLLWLWQPWGTL